MHLTFFQKFSILLMQTSAEKPYHSFKSVFEQYYAALCNYAFSIIKNKSASEDIVQDVFLKVWEKRPDIIGTDSVRFYLFTAVRNNALSFLKNEKKTQSVPLPREGLFDLNSSNPEKEQPSDYLSLIEEGLSLLPPKCKDVFLLSRIGNLSYKEIAATLHISVKTVDHQVGKAIKILKKFIRERKIVYLLPVTALLIKNILPGIGDWAIRLLF